MAGDAGDVRPGGRAREVALVPAPGPLPPWLRRTERRFPKPHAQLRWRRLLSLWGRVLAVG